MPHEASLTPLSAAPPCAAGRLVNGSYGRRVALHEAGHFLVAYLLGLLPKGYTLSSLDLFLRWATLAAGRPPLVQSRRASFSRGSLLACSPGMALGGAPQLLPHTVLHLSFCEA